MVRNKVQKETLEKRVEKKIFTNLTPSGLNEAVKAERTVYRELKK